jgi:hypothetical protein
MQGRSPNDIRAKRTAGAPRRTIAPPTTVRHGT